MRRLGMSFAAAVMAAAWSSGAAACTLGTPGTTQRIAVPGTGRSLLLRVPEGLRGRAPLVFVLHGSGGTGAGILDQSKLEATAERHDFLLAAPDAGIAVEKGFVWNIPGVPTVTGKVPGPDDADDVAYLGKVVEWLVARGCADRARAYATGLSGGGRMTSWLGCVASDRFAAIAPVVGLRAGNPTASEPPMPDSATCTPARPMPVMAFAGGKDTTNPVAGGGAGYWQYSMRAAEARWGDLNHCRRRRDARTLESGVIDRGYEDCRGGAEVIARITPEAGHVWAADNDAMWAFFARHRRR